MGWYVYVMGFLENKLKLGANVWCVDGVSRLCMHMIVVRVLSGWF